MDMSCEYVYGIVARYGADVTCVRSVVLARHVELLTESVLRIFLSRPTQCADLPLGAVRSVRIFRWGHTGCRKGSKLSG